VLSGHGGTFATRAMVASDLAAGRLRALTVVDTPPLYYENAIVALRGVSLPRAMAAFVEALRTQAHAMGAEQR